MTAETAAVEEAHAAVMQARVDGTTEPRRDDPAIARTHTGSALEHWNAVVDLMIPDPRPIPDPDFGGQLMNEAGWEVSYPPDSKRRVEIESVRFRDAGRVAVVEACVVDDGARRHVGGADDGFVFARGVTTIDVTDTMRQTDGVWRLAERHQNNRVKGAKRCADLPPSDAPESEPPPTPPSAEERERQAVISARHATALARKQALAAPWPTPDHPGLGETHTGVVLERAVLDAVVLQKNGFAIRYPEDSRSRLDMQSVTFDQSNDPPVAYLEVCAIDDAMRFVIDTEEVLSKDVYTAQLTEEMRRVHGRWRLAETIANRSTDGVSGCARDAPPSPRPGATEDPQTVIDARNAAERAWFETMEPPAANPDDPALARTHTGWALDVFSRSATSLQSGGTAFRVGPESRNRVDVESVTFSQSATMAYLRVCLVHDYDVVFDGDVVDSTLETLHVTESMRLQDGVWKLAGRWNFDVDDGAGGCAAD